MLLTLTNLGLTLGRPLFTGLSLTLHKGDRLGLIAANGRGKSSLLRLLAGEGEASGGEITRARGLTVGFVPQDPPADWLALPLREVIAGGLADASEDWRVEMLLAELEIPPEHHDKPLGALSGGWQRAALLARAWVREPDLLLMDEPTNHLDLTRIGFLQRWLAALPRDTAVILASHDRAFLDATTTRSLFLRPEASPVFALPYTRARQALDEADALAGKRFEAAQAQAAQLKRQAAKLKNIGINSGSDLLLTKTKQLTERAEKITAEARPAHKEGSAGAIRLAVSGSHAKALLTLADAEITAPDGRLLYKTGEKWLSPGDRVVVLGRNGTGKTRLMAAVIAALRGAPGAIRAASSVVAGVSDQSLSQLPEKARPFDLVHAYRDDAATRLALAHAGIAADRQTGPVSALSGGQKARLAMLLLRLQAPNLHLLDEPTNHLDIEGQEALEAELLRHDASALFVSHDRSFVRAVANRFWLIDRRRLVEIDDPEAFFAAELAQ